MSTILLCSGDGEKAPEAGALAGQLMKNPQVLAALQGRLEGMIGTRSGYIEKYAVSMSTLTLSALSLCFTSEFCCCKL